MAESTRQLSIVEYYGEQRKNRCGYCKQSDSCNSHGMQAHCLTNRDYQDLIDRGWRRSGTYCYKPKNDDTCCPCYTIKCDISTLTLSKSQKKIIKKFNRFLADGQRDKSEVVVASANQTDQHASMDCNSCIVEPRHSEIEFDVDKVKHIVTQSMKERPAEGYNTGIVQNGAVIVPNCSENHVSDSRSNEHDDNVTIKDTSRKSSVSGPDASKPLKKKAKLLRMERKAQKLASATQLPYNIATKEPKNVQKTLTALLNEVPANSRHKLEVKLQSSDESNKSIEVLKLYRKYQMAVHNDPPGKLTKSSFERFLVNSPLKVKLVAVAENLTKLSAEELCLYKRYQTVIHNDDEPSAGEFENFLLSSPLEVHISSQN